MKTKAEQYEFSDLSCCLITRSPIRHPILASDGKRYELKELYEWLLDHKNTSPLTREPVIWIHYDDRLKKELDRSNVSGRYEDYDKEEYLEKLINEFNSLYNTPRKQSVYKSIATINFCILLYASYLLLEDNNPQIQTSSMLLYMLVGGLIDYLLRASSQDHHSFFSIANRPITTTINYLTSAKEPSL